MIIKVVIGQTSGSQVTGGWSTVFTEVEDGSRIVRKLTDYVGGAGTKPTDYLNQYLKADGTFTTVISEAMDYSSYYSGGGGTAELYYNDIFDI